MADNKMNNYTLIEILHMSYLIRDSFEYLHEKMDIPEETFQRRATLAKQMLAQGKFFQSWLEGHPNDEIKKVYNQLVTYFHNIYEEENYVIFETRKADREKSVDFIEETLKLYQIIEDILTAFYKEYSKTAGVVEDRVKKCIIASKDYYRVVANWLFFNEIGKNDSEYKKALQESNGQQTYDVTYNVNILKRLIGGFNYAKAKYDGDKIDIKNMFDITFNSFKGLDGSLIKEWKEAHPDQTPDQATIEELTKKAVEKGAQTTINCLKIYEPTWKSTYNDVVKYMNENPLTPTPTDGAQA